MSLSLTHSLAHFHSHRHSIVTVIRCTCKGMLRAAIRSKNRGQGSEAVGQTSWSRSARLLHSPAPVVCIAAHCFAESPPPLSAHVQQVTPRNAAPGFSAMAVINEKFERISLQQYLDDKKWVVLLFYPFDFTVRRGSEPVGRLCCVDLSFAATLMQLTVLASRLCPCLLPLPVFSSCARLRFFLSPPHTRSSLRLTRRFLPSRPTATTRIWRGCARPKWTVGSAARSTSRSSPTPASRSARAMECSSRMRGEERSEGDDCDCSAPSRIGQRSRSLFASRI